MQEKRRQALKTLGALGAGVLAGESLKATMPQRVLFNTEPDSNGVVVGKSVKREILYHKTPAWDIFYKAVW
ncbi:hypothetical protein [Helicobacter suis]|uniref:Tat pathway signal protein n=1 Tax=Helicobacter suis TaxID=104628 RepID=A0A6J4CXW5_9HELI|nr:hypothetical protein [Helicobacter suis]BCD46179.1 hypothetical protein NHP190020_12180 [Helicobacter suis]BCD47899.1 hypothetical protein NHP194003_11030 [Helicobacter suis]BCD49659.1 hypothetical protein NHP194004_11060 [Helicobacter suis]BCD51144.1 hypothetical protein NHP194022_08150 [Helicobacter suis]BCD70367.1 hypothetical protein SNTW_10120 [Helicobacter suis]